MYRLFGYLPYSDKTQWKPEGKFSTIIPDGYGDFNNLHSTILQHKIEQGELPEDILEKLK